MGSGLSCWSGTGGWPEFSYHRCVRVPEARSGVGRGRSRPGTSSGLLSTRVLHHEEAAPQSPPPLTAALAGDTIDTRLDHVRPSVTGTCAPSTQRYAGQFVRFPLRNSSALVASRCYQGESWILDSSEGVCSGQARSKYPATSVLFSNCCQSLLLDPHARIGIDLRKRLFLLVTGRGE